MAVRTITDLKALFETDDVVTEASMIDLIDTMFSFSSTVSINDDISGGTDISCQVQKFGASASLTKITTGQYRVDIPADAAIINATITGGTVNVNASSELTLIIDDTDGNLYRPAVVGVISAGAAMDVTLFKPNYTVSAVGQITMIIPNLNFGANGWKLVLVFSNSLT